MEKSATLAEAQAAEKELARLTSLAEEAPRLREAQARERVRGQRQAARVRAWDSARELVEEANRLQETVPGLLETAARAAFPLFQAFQELGQLRGEALEHLRAADHADFEAELEDSIRAGQDRRVAASSLAALHGDLKVERLLEELKPRDYLEGCDLSLGINRDVGNFILAHAIPSAAIALPRSTR